MAQAQFFSLVIVAVGLLLAAARALGMPHSVLLFAGGLALAFVPDVPPMHIEPRLVLGLFLPPLLYASTALLSVHLVRHNLVRGVGLGIVLVVAIVAAVACLTRLMMPELPWESALLLGIVASVADTRLLKESNLDAQVPRAIGDVLLGHAIATPLVLLTAFQLASQAVGGDAPGIAGILSGFAKDWLAGAAAGVAIGFAVAALRGRIDTAAVEIAVSIATPYLASIAAQTLGISIPVVVIVSALVVSARSVDPRTGRSISSPEARLLAKLFWREASLILSGLLFFLVGYALPATVKGLERFSVTRLALVALALFAAIMAVQFALAFAAALGSRSRVPGAEGAPIGPARAAAVTSWISSRSVLGLLIALAIPVSAPGGAFADREPLVVLSVFLILGSILIQGSTMPALLRWAGLGGQAEREAETTAAASLLRALDAKDEGSVTRTRCDLIELRRDDRISDEVYGQAVEELELRARVVDITAKA